MAVRAICRNCDREMAIMQDGMCGGCFGRAKYHEGKDREGALASARADFAGKPPRTAGNRSARKPKVEKKAKKDPASGAIDAGIPLGGRPKVEGLAFIPDVSAPVSTRKTDQKAPSSAEYPKPKEVVSLLDNPSIISIMVNFTDNDQALFDSLQALSRKFRRSPDQQILWMIEQGIDYFNKNLSGEEVAQ